MHVLVTEAYFGDSAGTVRRLREAGCRVSTCHTEAGLCKALAPGSRCPLDVLDGVDLLVDVRSVGDELTAREFGTVCAVRARVPVVVVGADPDRRPTLPIGLESRVLPVRGRQLAATCRSWQRAHEASGGHRS
ncbi:hypothetical protein [Prauserella muralis]|uniref:Uncharacterized protein n=1 Tax=Prauserella muralis TaxID=588067 RepID=A0A2V4ANN1_9PSEU|nr:hypothetical protein [Prauserella muralis]PXY22310.1 hypothetical protein BAY60_20775 [Prauserella muralis]TWE27959.1 hypothetical protein FHX69_0608 [Prauserella muralis]